ncbi:hypothetical protein CDO52_24555 [Nocardiopsis gilva YIM 90087]|uniref:Lactococcin 972 family bacteriocin n=1 Tax=Nocardiopsis gilva YIM 90087 TaxID=1235441 RepID=A0A223SBZ5_9ACTN|nr:hypothetical protein [Nocardiopsis gilva]ASU85549.1 hypothetical protein CDO52_24555 [Nocardiopsis gilva YIM 90087]
MSSTPTTTGRSLAARAGAIVAAFGLAGTLGVAIASPAEAACRSGGYSVTAYRSYAWTNTAHCRYYGRSWARHGRYYASTPWTSKSSSAYARHYTGATPRYAGYALTR